MKAILFSWLFSFMLYQHQPAFAQDIADLARELETGGLKFVELHGKGSSSGASMEGQLENLTQSEIRIFVSFRRPLYLGNQSGGSRQNMIALRIYNAGGGYYSDGTSSFIVVGPGERIDVQLTAYCADFDKDNPEYSDSFVVSSVPDNLSGIALKMARYQEANPAIDLTVPSQLALWLSQGNSASEIGAKFPFSPADESIAREIMAQPVERFRITEP